MKYYFVGIKGTGMSALAKLLKDQGNEVEDQMLLNTILQKTL